MMRYLIAIVLAILICQPVWAANDQRGVAVSKQDIDSRKRVALVIGNSNYRISPLKNPANDAKAMAAALRRLGFDVEEKTDLNYVAMNKVVESFGKRLAAGGVGLFYYAGHGVQVNGANYLLPVDAEIEDENEVRYKAIDAGLVLAKMEQSRGDVNLVVLDACRNNPFARSFRSATRGLASMDAPSGSMIAYATAPGKTAADGSGGKYGVYTEELIRMMETPGLSVEEAFKRVRKAVMTRTANAQVPWESSSLVGDFRFLDSESNNINQLSATQSAEDLSTRTRQSPDKLIPKTTESINQQTAMVSNEIKPFTTSDKLFAVSELTIFDNKTGLMWLRDGSLSKDIGWRDVPFFISSINSKEFAGHSDWRLPTKMQSCKVIFSSNYSILFCYLHIFV